MNCAIHIPFGLQAELESRIGNQDDRDIHGSTCRLLPLSLIGTYNSQLLLRLKVLQSPAAMHHQIDREQRNWAVVPKLKSHLHHSTQ